MAIDSAAEIQAWIDWLNAGDQSARDELILASARLSGLVGKMKVRYLMGKSKPGNGSGKFDVGAHDMGGWVRVIASNSPGTPDELGVYLAAPGSLCGSANILACSPFFGPPDKGDYLGHPHMSLLTSHCSVMSSPPVAGCAELFGRRVIE